VGEIGEGGIRKSQSRKRQNRYQKEFILSSHIEINPALQTSQPVEDS
jgi:hypothetical protein